MSEWPAFWLKNDLNDCCFYVCVQYHVGSDCFFLSLTFFDFEGDGVFGRVGEFASEGGSFRLYDFYVATYIFSVLADRSQRFIDAWRGYFQGELTIGE